MLRFPALALRSSPRADAAYVASRTARGQNIGVAEHRRGGACWRPNIAFRREVCSKEVCSKEVTCATSAVVLVGCAPEPTTTASKAPRNDDPVAPTVGTSEPKATASPAANYANWKKISAPDSFTDKVMTVFHLPPFDHELATATFLELSVGKGGNVESSIRLPVAAEIRLFDPDRAFIHTRFDKGKAQMCTVRTIQHGQIAFFPRAFTNELLKIHGVLLIRYASFGGEYVDLSFLPIGADDAAQGLLANRAAKAAVR
jgi:hypothetical protein